MSTASPSYAQQIDFLRREVEHTRGELRAAATLTDPHIRRSQVEQLGLRLNMFLGLVDAVKVALDHDLNHRKDPHQVRA